MMNVIMNRKCPSCNARIPYFAISNTKWEGFSKLLTICQNCGLLLETKINLKNALLSWPPGLLIIIAVTIYANSLLFNNKPLLSILVFFLGAIVGLLIIGLGVDFISTSKYEDLSVSKTETRTNFMLRWAGITIFGMIFALLLFLILFYSLQMR
jgi:hypothetical protein